MPSDVNIFFNKLDYSVFKQTSHIIQIIILCMVFVVGPLIVCFLIGKELRKKYQVPDWYFWIAYIFVVPVIAAPLILFGSCFIDNPKNDVLAIVAYLLINSYAFWLIGGFYLSIFLYKEFSCVFSLTPSFLSWLFAAVALIAGYFLIA